MSYWNILYVKLKLYNVLLDTQGVSNTGLLIITR